MRNLRLGFCLCLAAMVALLQVDVGAASAALAVHSASPGWLDVLKLGALCVGVALGTGNLTLMDQAKRLDPSGRIANIVELLNQTNEVLDDMSFVEGNTQTGHRVTVRTGLPAVAWRLLNQGVVPSKSTTAQIDEQAGMLEAWSEVDKDLLMLNGNSAAFRLSEARAFIEAMNQEFVRVLFYGNGGVNPEQFTGLSVRYSASTAGNGANVLKAGGVGSDNASIWLVCWGPDSITGIFPKGSQAGLIHEDYGEVTIDMVAGLPGARMRGMQERFQWKAGIALKDWRYVVRICNIDVSDLLAANVKTILNFMEQAGEMIPSRMGKPVFYMNRTMRWMLRKEVRETVGSGGGITFENVDGRRIAMFNETPVRLVDQLLNSEALVP
jgi:hypothetical protein